MLFENADLKLYYQKLLSSYLKIRVIEKNLAFRIGLPVLGSVFSISTGKREIKRLGPETPDLVNQYTDLKTLSGLWQRATIIKGRLPRISPEGKVLEVLISTRAQKNYGLVLDKIYC